MADECCNPAPAPKRSHKKKVVAPVEPAPAKRNLLAERLIDSVNKLLEVVSNNGTDEEKAKAAAPLLGAAAELMVSLAASNVDDMTPEELIKNIPEDLQIPDGLLDRLCPLARACALLGMFSTLENLGIK